MALTSAFPALGEFGELKNWEHEATQQSILPPIPMPDLYETEAEEYKEQYPCNPPAVLPTGWDDTLSSTTISHGNPAAQYI